MQCGVTFWALKSGVVKPMAVRALPEGLDQPFHPRRCALQSEPPACVPLPSGPEREERKDRGRCNQKSDMPDPSTQDKYRSFSVSLPSSSSAMSTVGGASLGTLIGSGIAVASLAFVGPAAVAVPSLITLAGGGIGALSGYLHHKHQEESAKKAA